MSLSKADAIREARAYRAYAALKPANATPSRTVTNASTDKPYKPSSWPVRAGADDHASIQSKGYV